MPSHSASIAGVRPTVTASPFSASLKVRKRYPSPHFILLRSTSKNLTRWGWMTFTE